MLRIRTPIFAASEAVLIDIASMIAGASVLVVAEGLFDEADAILDSRAAFDCLDRTLTSRMHGGGLDLSRARSWFSGSACRARRE